MRPFLPLAALAALSLPAQATEVPPMAAEPARTECSACHMAYPPGLLPARSWKAIMGSLDKHFGENASLDPATAKKIEDYLVANSAEAMGFTGVTRGLAADQTPLRIADMPWWRSIHGDPAGRWFHSGRVAGPGDCAACHEGAQQGFFHDE